MDINEIFYNTIWITIYSLILIGFVFGVTAAAASYKRSQKEKLERYKLTFLQVKLPPDNEIEIKSAEHMFSNIMGFKRGFWATLFGGQYRISFEIVSKIEGIGFYVVVPDEIAVLVEKQINAAYPTAEIDIIDPKEIWDRGSYTMVSELKLKSPAYYPIKVYEDQKNDSLSSITNAMSKMGEDEVLAVQYVIQPAGDSWRMAGRRFISTIRDKAANPEKKVNIDTKFLEGVEKKISHPGFHVKIRIVAIANDSISAGNHTQSMITAFEQFTDMSYNRFVKRMFIPQVKIVNDFIYRRISVKDWYIPIVAIPIYTNTALLNIVELATIFHFPNKNIETPSIMWLGARRSSAPTNLPEEGLYLGKSVFRGITKNIFMKEEDRQRHFYIIGQTGTGKSQLMMWLALQDIKDGKGLAIIDPHGTDVEELLAKIPPERKDDVIYFDASDSERPLGINLLEAHSEEEKHMLINSFIALLYKLYDPNKQGIMGPLLERAIRNVMLTAMADPTSTMVDVMRLLIDDKYYKKFLDKLDDPLVKRYWTDEVANTSQARKGETMGYFVSKFDRLVTDKTMRNIIGQPKSSFNFSEVMAQKKILLVDLAKGKIGEENSNFLGLLLVPRILSAALGRHKLLTQGMDFPNFYLYVDEFQNFATPDFATILSEARKYKLNLTVAHQFIAQLDNQIKDAVFGNVGTTCVFRVGAEDSEFLEKQFQPKFTKSDLINLPVGNCYVRLLVKGQPTSPFSMNIDWSELTAVKKDPQVAAEIKQLSRNKYGVPAQEVEAFVNSHAAPDTPELPPLPDIMKNKLPF